MTGSRLAMSDPNYDERLVFDRDYRNEPWVVGMPGPKLIPGELKGYEMRPTSTITGRIRTEDHRRRFRLPRWIHRLYAAVFGYFWTTCWRCGKAHGGHEYQHPVFDYVEVGKPARPLMCPRCTKALSDRLSAALNGGPK